MIMRLMAMQTANAKFMAQGNLPKATQLCCSAKDLGNVQAFPTHRTAGPVTRADVRARIAGAYEEQLGTLTAAAKSCIPGMRT